MQGLIEEGVGWWVTQELAAIRWGDSGVADEQPSRTAAEAGERPLTIGRPLQGCCCRQIRRLPVARGEQPKATTREHRPPVLAQLSLRSLLFLTAKLSAKSPKPWPLPGRTRRRRAQQEAVALPNAADRTGERKTRGEGATGSAGQPGFGRVLRRRARALPARCSRSERCSPKAQRAALGPRGNQAD